MKSVEIIHKEIDLIQACIDKYDKRSMLIRGWSVGLIILICGLSATDVLFFNSNAKPVSFSLLLIVNYIFRLIDIDNSKKKFQFIQLYQWVIENRSLDDDKPWGYLYNLDYRRFPIKAGQFEYSEFGKKLYTLTWGFIFCLAVWYTFDGWGKKDKPANKMEISNSDSSSSKIKK